jgi:hypothetical protein
MHICTGRNGVDTFSNAAIHAFGQLDLGAASHLENSPRNPLRITQSRYGYIKEEEEKSLVCLPVIETRFLNRPTPSLQFIRAT